MRALVQRVTQAAVVVGSETRGRIDRGLLVFLGIGVGDATRDVAWMANKIVGLRMFEDDAGKMNRSVLDVGGSLLVVSQFTLYGDVQKGKRPSFTGAMEPVGAEAMYQSFCEACRGLGASVQEGVFRADMKVSLINDGPVTLILESPTRPAEDAS